MCNYKPEETLRLYFSDYFEKYRASLSVGSFYASGKFDPFGEEGLEAKYEAEYQYLKSIGFFNKGKKK